MELLSWPAKRDDGSKSAVERAAQLLNKAGADIVEHYKEHTMKLEELKSLSKDDILGALGLETKRSTSGVVASGLAVFGMGLVVGAAAALMMAPKTGRELRDDVSSRLRSFTSKDGTKLNDGEISALT